MRLLLPNAFYYRGVLEQMEYSDRLENSILVLVQDLVTHLLLWTASSAFFALYSLCYHLTSCSLIYPSNHYSLTCFMIPPLHYYWVFAKIIECLKLDNIFIISVISDNFFHLIFTNFSFRTSGIVILDALTIFSFLSLTRFDWTF